MRLPDPPVWPYMCHCWRMYDWLFVWLYRSFLFSEMRCRRPSWHKMSPPTICSRAHLIIARDWQVKFRWDCSATCLAHQRFICSKTHLMVAVAWRVNRHGIQMGHTCTMCSRRRHHHRLGICTMALQVCQITPVSQAHGSNPETPPS